MSIDPDVQDSGAMMFEVFYLFNDRTDIYIKRMTHLFTHTVTDLNYKVDSLRLFIRRTLSLRVLSVSQILIIKLFLMLVFPSARIISARIIRNSSIPICNTDQKLYKALRINTKYVEKET